MEKDNSYIRSLKECFQSFKKGDLISDLELKHMIEETKQAIAYLEAREDSKIVLHTLYLDLHSMEQILWYREVT